MIAEWLERWYRGEWVPHAALMQCPDLLKIVSQDRAIFSVARDAYRRHP